MILHLGENDEPYVDKSGVSTFDVAMFIEAKYHVMETFFELHSQEIADHMASGMANTIEALARGAPPGIDPYGEAMAWIEQRFKHFLANKELDALGIPGIPTKAAKEGISSRFKAGTGPKGRPSFIDTTLYESNFRSWIT